MTASQGTECKPPCACRLALAVGIVWGLGAFLLGAITTCTESYGHKAVEVLGSIYCGYRPGSWSGAFFGLLWGFVDAFVATAVIVGLYALLSRAGGCCCRKDDAGSADAEPQVGAGADA